MSWLNEFLSRNAIVVSNDVDRLKSITKARAEITNNRFGKLRGELEKMKMVNVALVRLLIAKNVFSESELNKLIDEIEVGIKDGIIIKKPPNKSIHRSP